MLVSDRPSGRHQSYHELLEQLAAPGCAVCHLGARSVDRYLDGLDWELVNDPGIRELITRETVQVAQGASQLAAAQGYSALVAAIQEETARYQAGLPYREVK